MRGVNFGVLICFICFLAIPIASSQENIPEKLDKISTNLETSQNYLLDGKITELTNTMWDNVDPEINLVLNYIENNIFTLKDVGIYDISELNLSQGDLNRGIDIFNRMKIDVDYEINDMIFDRKINEAKDIVNNLKIISLLIPEIEVSYSKKNELITTSKEMLDDFSMDVKDVDTYSKIKVMNVTKTNQKIGISYDEIIYTYSNIDEENKTLTIKLINKKIVAKETLKNVEIYEIFPDYFNLSQVIFKSTHAPDKDKNRVLIYKGTLYANRTIPLNFLIKSNESIEKISMTIVSIPESAPSLVTPKEETITVKKNNDKVKFEDIEIIEKQNYFPYILLGILVLIFLLLIWGNLTTKNKLANDLEKYRRKINNLKGNV